MMFQEVLRDEPFWMLVMCSLVNLTSRAQAEPVLDVIRHRWPDAYALSMAENDLVDVLRPLGLQNQRATNLRKMADHWTRMDVKTSEDVKRLPGCGQYAADSWAIFQEGRTDVEPTDRKLRLYLDRLHDRNTGL